MGEPLAWKDLVQTAGSPMGERYGWHAFRREFATELKHTPLSDLAALGGWKSAQTLLQSYMRPDEATQRAALEKRRELHAGGLS